MCSHQNLREQPKSYISAMNFKANAVLGFITRCVDEKTSWREFVLPIIKAIALIHFHM